jgi:MFS family permease
MTSRNPTEARVPEEKARAVSLARMRIGVTLFFALGGFLFAGWAVRLPAIKAQVHASPGALGLALLCMTGSAVITMALMGRVCERIGSRQATIASAALLSVAILPPTFVHSAWALGLTLVLFGIGYGGIDVAVNSVGIDLVTALGRPVMPGFHAANSFGSLAGAGLGGLVAPYLSPTQHMILLVPVGVLATVIGGRMLLASPLPTSVGTDDGPGRGPVPVGRIWRRLSLPVVTFGLVALCAAYCQGSLDNWVPLHITADLRGSQAAAAAGYATVQGTLGVMRLGGITLVTRFGPVLVTTVGGLMTCGGGLLAALAPSLWLAYVGLAATGIGLANIFPTALAQAGAAGGAQGIAVAATLGYCGILAAPPSIGLLADVVGLPAAMTLIPAMAALAAVIGYLTRRQTSAAPRGS